MHGAGELALRAAGPGAGVVVLPHLCAVLLSGGEQEEAPVASITERPDGTLVLAGESPSFAFVLRLGPEGSDVSGGRSANLSATCNAPAPVEASLRVALRLGATVDPGWLIPGLFYGENRAGDAARRFPRFTATAPRHELLESDYWSFRCDRAATPAVFAWDDQGGAALLVEEEGPLGENGLGFGLYDGVPHLWLDFPYREEPVVYDGSEQALPPTAATARWAPGEQRDLSFSVHLLGGDRHAYAPVLRALSERSPTTPFSQVAWVGIEEAAELTAWGLSRWHYRSDPPVLLETAAFDREALGERGDRQAMHVSWVSGTPYAYALLRHGARTGDDERRATATSVLDNIAGNLAPGGTFWGQWSKERGWSIGWTPEPHRLHARTLADATLFLLRALVFERSCGRDHPVWERAVRSNLEVAARARREDGAIGAAFSAVDGSVLDWRGSAGLAFVAPLAEAAGPLGEPAWLAVAEAAGGYFARFVEAEHLCGAPEDVDLAPTSEDGYLAVISYLALWRCRREARWLELARRAADWMLTFRYTYDVAFSEHTLLGRYGFRTRGADQASPSNQHLHAFGLICLPEMDELSTALADPHYRERAKETLACFRQFVARQDGDFDAYRGMVSERFYQTTCFQAKGMLLTLSHAWSVGVLLLACEEVLSRPSPDDWEYR
ncbi:MAG: hypothetical protein JWM85_1788 [Acidimicrobiaceae bacterium]|nr:hypothetical protein [Acidimicrobiaceae bacterium]